MWEISQPVYKIAVAARTSEREQFPLGKDASGKERKFRMGKGRGRLTHFLRTKEQRPPSSARRGNERPFQIQNERGLL